MVHVGVAVRRVLIGVLAFACLLGLAAFSPAQAADPIPASPGGLTPSGTTLSGIPTLAWDRVPTALSYDVQLASDSGFTQLIGGLVNTANDQYVPTSQLISGTIFWRVRARNGAGASDFSTSQFTRAAIDVPQAAAPADGAVIDSPRQAISYRWNPVAGATQYSLQVGDDSSFTDPNRYKTFTTTTTSYVDKALPSGGTRYWRVQASLGNVKSDWSTAHSYSVVLFKPDYDPDPVSPANDPNAAVQDSVLSWHPIPGATTYQVQVALDDNFTKIAYDQSGIVGTSYAKPRTLNNDQYWWRVRPADAAGHQADWAKSPVWTFKRNWPDQPHLQYPADGATVTSAGRMFYQWSGTRLASKYRLQVSTSPGFDDDCAGRFVFTVNTTYTPAAIDRDCMPQSGRTYYWRVIGIDENQGDLNGTPTTAAVSAEVRSFTYLLPQLVLVSPAPGQSVTVPTLTWQAQSEAATYKVTITSSSGAVVTADTPNPSYTPRTALPANTYHWQVQTRSQDGRLGAATLFGDQPTFTVIAQTVATSLTPDPTGAGATADGPRAPRFSTLTWQPVTGATKYSVRIRRAGLSTWQTIAGSFGYPAGEDTTTAIFAPGLYEWQVDAFNNSVPLTTGAIGHLTISPLPVTTGYRTALVGTDLDSSDPEVSCDATAPKTCQNLRQTPALRWASDPDAAYYMLYLSHDAELTNLLPSPLDKPQLVYGNTWSPKDALEESNAESGIYWEAVPCTATNGCQGTRVADHVFNKQANPVKLLGESSITNDITLRWADYLDDPGTFAGGPSYTSTLTTPATSEARGYRVQTSTSANFSSLIDNVVVDQMSFTSPTNLYPDGPIFWRVQALDGSNQALSYGEVRTVDVRSSSPTDRLPAANANFDSDALFSWSALPFSASYEVRILRNDPTTIDTGTAVAGDSNIQQSSYALTTPLPVIAPGVSGTTNNYRWFIRRKNVNGGFGPWSDGIPFRVVADTPAQTSPNVGASVGPREGYFTWNASPGAVYYRFERRAAGSSNPDETVDTAGLAYAPTGVMRGGASEWRITTLDASKRTLATSPWRPFTVDALVGSVTISGQGRVGGLLSANTPAWTPTGVTTTWQWYAGTSALTGETTQNHTVKSSDVGKALTVRATGTKPGYDPVTITSNAINGSLPPTLQASVSPALTGSPRIGSTLTTSTGTWPAGTTFTYSWLRDGVAVAGRTLTTYVVGTADANHRLQAVVTGHLTGYAEGTSRTALVTVPKAASRTTGRLAYSRIRARAYPRITVTVAATGILHASGPIRIYDGTRLIKSATLYTGNAGRLLLTLPRRTVGRHQIQVRYLGNTYTNASRSLWLTLTVVR